MAAIEIDAAACATLRTNRQSWRVIEGDLHAVDGRDFVGVDLIAGGVPCPPFSIAGKQLGRNDERDLFPVALRIIRAAKPRAVMLENVPGFASSRFEDYRNEILVQLTRMGYTPDWRILHASDHGVSQLRPRFVLVAVKQEHADNFHWPSPEAPPLTVGERLRDLMEARSWPGAERWSCTANGIAPTIVGGSKKHGGPDLGPTRARKEWAKLGVDGISIADDAPGPDVSVETLPRLTVRMVARLQGFPDAWNFHGRKTAAYRQVGNAFPPPVAAAVAIQIRAALDGIRRDLPRHHARRTFQPALFR